MIMHASIFEVVTFAIAIIGAVLGVMNFARDVWKDLTRIKVTPMSFFFESGSRGIAVEVVNLSRFPVTISSVGLWDSKGQQLPFVGEHVAGDHTPKRLEPLTSMLLVAPWDIWETEGFQHISSAFAKTQCGRQFHGNGPALKAMVKLAKHRKANQ